MQNRYAGDVGDFGKFGLLRHLIAQLGVRFGVNWYLYPDESHNEDGKYTEYFVRSEFRDCDDELLDRLRGVVTGTRSVEAMQCLKLLPGTKDSDYFSQPLDGYQKHPGNTASAKTSRTALRSEWLQRAVHALAGCNAVFLDPDNGLEVASCPSVHRKNAGKYAFYQEVKTQSAGKSLTVIYHHLNRHRNYGPHTQQMREKLSALRERVNPSGGITALRFFPYSPRAYFFMSNTELNGRVEEAIRRFLDSPWGHVWDKLIFERDL